MVWLTTQLLAFLNTSLNFFIYALINEELRSAFRSILCLRGSGGCCGCCGNGEAEEVVVVSDEFRERHNFHCGTSVHYHDSNTHAHQEYGVDDDGSTTAI